MKAAHWASRHARSVLFLLVALVAGGIFASGTIPVSLFPHVNFPLIRVNVDAGDRPVQRMIVEVTSPIEEALRAVPGVRSVKSTNSRGNAQIWLTFDWGQDMISALLQAEAQINRTLPNLPQGTAFEIKRMDPTVFPAIAYTMTSRTRPQTELHDLAQYQLRPILSRVSGVAGVAVEGGAISEYRVTVDPAKLQARGLAISDVATALSAASVINSVGHVEENDRLYMVITDTQFKSLDEIGATVLRSAPGGVTLLKDVATLRQDRSPQFTHSTAEGRDAVMLDVFQQPGGNTVEIAAEIRRAVQAEQDQHHLPSDVTVTSWYDQSDLISSSAQSVRDAVIIGVVLAALVLLLFLRNLRMTLIAILAVPIVLAVTALLLYVMGQSFNIMTLGGMAAAVGLIIDDAIVISEHIVRRLHARGSMHADAKQRVLGATEEFTKPLSGSSLSTIVIQIPPVFLVGVFGAFFAALSVSMASSLIISFFVAWLAIPIVAARWLRKQDVEPEHEGAITRAAYASYSWVMGPILRFPWLVLLLAIPFLVWGYREYGQVKSGLMPNIDEGGFVFDFFGPPGASVTEMDRLLVNVQKILHDIPEVQAYSCHLGFQMGGDITESDMGDCFVRLKPFPRRSIDEVMKDFQDRIASTTPGPRVEPAQLMDELIGDLSGNPQPIVVNLYSDDEQILADLPLKVADGLGKVNGVIDVDSGIVPAGDALDVQVDRVKASLEGVDPDSLTNSLEALLRGVVTTQVQDGPKMVDVRLWIPRSYFKTSDNLANLSLRAPDGHLFPLKRVAAFNVLSGQPEITRDNLKRVVSITARIDETTGRDLGSVIGDVKNFLDQPGMIPEGVRYTLGGQYEQQQIVFAGVVRVIIAAGALVFFLLLFLYERFRVAGAIMFTTVLAVAAVFIGLRWTGTELNLSSLMGMVMIVGNVTEVAIFYYSEYADFLTEGTDIDRLIEAGKYRMRAITMTTMAAILALLPLAVNFGSGTGMLQPLAIAIITGLIVQLPLVLIVLPALLRMMRVHK